MCVYIIDIDMEKKAKLTGQEAENCVLDYVSRQNRPYNVQNIFDNLHGCVAKPLLMSILDKLVADGRVIAKEYGKAKVFLASQENMKTVNCEELEVETAESEKKRKELDELVLKQKEKKEHLGKMFYVPMLLLDVRRSNELMENEIRNVLEGAAKLNLTDEEITNISLDYDKKVVLARKRRKLCMDIVSQMTENSDMTTEQALKAFGIAD